MNKLIVILALIVGFSYSSATAQSQPEKAGIDTIVSAYQTTNTAIQYPLMHAEPYELKLEVLKLDSDVYDFVVSMHLNNGSFYVSPNAKRDFSGKFTIFIDDTNKLEAVSKLLETPLSIEVFDPHPFVAGKVNWVKENTTYNQKLQRTSEDDFIVTGLIQFTIEPRCSLEKIPFVISYKEGEMTVKIDNC